MLDVLFPRRCAACGAGAWPFCDACRSAAVPLAPPWCVRCGAPQTADHCSDCPPEPITSARAPFLFTGPVRQAVHRLKFAGRRDVAPALAAAIGALGPAPTVEAATWVPLARRRLAERGFDQARALAGPVARGFGLPLVRLLRRTEAGGPQARRSGLERRAAMPGAFLAIGPPPERVLLIDDVLTTGATAAACAEALMASGAREVHLLVAARALQAPPSRAYPRMGPRPGLWLPGDLPR
jgi:predicted amidophosphoribosyltransferase